MYKYVFVFALTYAVVASLAAEIVSLSPKPAVLSAAKVAEKKPSQKYSVAVGWPLVAVPYAPRMAPSPEELEVPKSPRPEPTPDRRAQIVASIQSPPVCDIDPAYGFDPDWVESSRISSIHKGACGGERLWRVGGFGPDSRVDVSPSVISGAPLISALSRWEQDVQEAALKYLGEPIVEIQHVGSYVCKRIMNRKFGPWSEHAKANALDVTGFETLGGDVITIESHWGDDGRKGRFIRAVHESACEAFTLVLSPNFNRAHAGHFHIDMGRHRGCR